MTVQSDASVPEWDDASWALLDDAVSKLEVAWEQVGIPEISEFVPVGRADPRYDEMLVRLIAVHRQRGAAAGAGKELAAYLAEYPNLRNHPGIIREIGDSAPEHLAPTVPLPELDGDVPRQDLAKQAAPVSSRPLTILCPSSGCHNRIEIAEEEVAEQLRCPSCGKSFSLSDAGVPVTRSGEGRVRIRRQLDVFMLIEQLGTGAFGSVWKAKEARLDRIVAIKIPRYGRLGAEQRKRFVQEAQAAAQLKHPNIVAVHAVGGTGDQLYIASDYVDALPFNDWLAGRRVDYRAPARLCATIAEAVHYAHDHGIIHRDLKPQNILIDVEDQPHITDFGLAKRDVRVGTEADEAEDGAGTIEGMVMGTPEYLSPEQAAGKSHEADRRSDVYSLGVILFELLTGERPFRGTQHMLLRQHIEDEPPAPRKLVGNIPRDLETICLKCLEKPPSQRYQSAGEMAAELRRYLEGEPIQARRIGHWERSWRWCKRNPLVAGLSASVTFLLLAIAIVAPVVAMHQGLLRQAAETLAGEKTQLVGQVEQTLEKQQQETERAEAERDRSERNLRRFRVAHYAGQLASAQDWMATGDFLTAQGLLAAAPGSLRGWEHGHLMAVLRRRMRTMPGHSDDVRSVAFSPDGSRIVSGSSDNTIKIWEADTGRQLRTLTGHTGGVISVAFSPDGSRIVSGSCDKTIKIWEAATGRQLRTLTGHTGSVISVAFSPDGSRIVSGSFDNTIKIWDPNPGEELRTLTGHTDVVSSVAFSPDGSRIVSGSADKSINVWDAETGDKVRVITGHSGYVSSVAFSPDGTKIVSSNGYVFASTYSMPLVRGPELNLWDAANGQRLFTLAEDVALQSVAWSPDGSRITSGGLDGTVKIWDAHTGEQLHTLTGLGGGERSVAFNPHGSRIVSGDTGGEGPDLGRGNRRRALHAERARWHRDQRGVQPGRLEDRLGK